MVPTVGPPITENTKQNKKNHSHHDPKQYSLVTTMIACSEGTDATLGKEVFDLHPSCGIGKAFIFETF